MENDCTRMPHSGYNPFTQARAQERRKDLIWGYIKEIKFTG